MDEKLKPLFTPVNFSTVRVLAFKLIDDFLGTSGKGFVIFWLPPVFQATILIKGSITFPFVSNGGTAMIASWGLLPYRRHPDHWQLSRPREDPAGADGGHRGSAEAVPRHEEAESPRQLCYFCRGRVGRPR